MTDALRYMTGFGGHFESEAIEGALPRGRNSPQRPAFGLYAEQVSGSSFTSPRHENRRSWLYRMRPTADHRPFKPYGGSALDAGSPKGPVAPNRLRWDPPADLPGDRDFVDGLVTMLVNRDPAELTGVALPEPFGARTADVVASIRRLRERLPLAGATLTEFSPSSPDAAVDDLGTILRLIGALA